MDGFANLRENIRSEASSPSGTVGPQPEAGAGAVRGAAAAPAQRQYQTGAGGGPAGGVAFFIVKF